LLELRIPYRNGGTQAFVERSHPMLQQVRKSVDLLPEVPHLLSPTTSGAEAIRPGSLASKGGKWSLVPNQTPLRPPVGFMAYLIPAARKPNNHAKPGGPTENPSGKQT